tara:strand:- start:25 stop:540 length:516 start_codon:yes stop_codon:yes gene_type:complete
MKTSPNEHGVVITVNPGTRTQKDVIPKKYQQVLPDNNTKWDKGYYTGEDAMKWEAFDYPNLPRSTNYFKFYSRHINSGWSNPVSQQQYAYQPQQVSGGPRLEFLDGGEYDFYYGPISLIVKSNDWPNNIGVSPGSSIPNHYFMRYCCWNHEWMGGDQRFFILKTDSSTLTE